MITIDDKKIALLNKIKQLSEKYFNEIVHIRRYLHQNPELSFQEYNTSKYIFRILEEMDLKPEKKATTGILVTLKGTEKLSKKTVALRADIDALPILEKNDIEYKSQNDGVMHACGHDVHTASLIGVIKILSELKNNFSGTVKFIFQPGEELLPGGANLMINEKVLENPTPNSIFGQHVISDLEAGTVGFCKEIFCASSDEIRLKIIGKGGHAATPHNLIDPIVIASNIIMNLQQIISRNKPPLIPSLLSFGKIVANGATNIIPDEVYIEGTFRAMNEKWRKKAHELIKKNAENIAKAMNAKCEVNITKGYPCLINDKNLVNSSIEYAKTYLGIKNIKVLDPFMFAEDFAYYSHKIPACFYALGVANKKKQINSPIHTSTFNIDENALKTSIGLMSWLTINQLD